MDDKNGKLRIIIWLFGIIQAITIPWAFYITGMAVNSRVEAAAASVETQNVKETMKSLAIDVKEIRKLLERRRD